MERESVTLISPAPESPKDVRYIELKTDLTVGSGDLLAAATCDAYLLDKDGVRYEKSLVKVCNQAGVRRAALGADSVGNDAYGSPRRGAMGQAVLNPRRNVLEIVSLQRLAEVIYGTIDATFAAAATTVVLREVKTAGQVYDQLPPLSYGGKFTVSNLNKLAGAQDDPAMAILDIATNSYRLICCPTAMNWAKVQSGFYNADGTTYRTVSVKPCTWLGVVSGSPAAFDVKTPIQANRDTALFTDYIVRWHSEADGSKVIDSDCWDDPIGTIRAVGVDTAVRDGWEELTDAKGRFMVGASGDVGDAWRYPGSCGGADLDNLRQGMQDHPEGYGADCFASTFKIHTKLDASYGTLNHRLVGDGTSTGASNLAPPWYSIKWIKRTT